MRIKLTLFILFAMVGTVRAESYYKYFDPRDSLRDPLWAEAHDSTGHINPESVVILDSETAKRNFWFGNSDYAVIHGTTAVKLDEFVSSGKLCEYRGRHEENTEIVEYDYPRTRNRKAYFRCNLCKKRRRAGQTEWEN